MRKRVIIEITKTKTYQYLIQSTSQPQNNWKVTSISPISSEELGSKIYDILKTSPDLEPLELNLYSAEEYDNYKLIHKELLDKLLTNCQE
jgi:hypothetical protein